MSKNQKRIDNQVLQDALGTMKLVEAAVNCALNENESIASACRKYGIEANQLRHLLYSMCPIASKQGRKLDRKELDEALEKFGPVDGVEALYESVFAQTPLGKKRTAELMPPDANETVEYIFDHPSRFGLTGRGYKILRRHVLQGKREAEIAKEFQLSENRVSQILAMETRRFRRKSTYRLLLFGLADYAVWEKEKEAARKEAVEEEKKEMLAAIKKEAAKTVAKELGNPIDDDDRFTVRDKNALHRSGIRTTDEILHLSYNELIRMRGVGTKTIENVIAIMQMDHPGWLPEDTPEEIAQKF